MSELRGKMEKLLLQSHGELPLGRVEEKLRRVVDGEVLSSFAVIPRPPMESPPMPSFG
ncbi:unnamed protein product [Effrenium voratum]|uniref:Uncharacterized protein n=1 Tax=Effrenium voratum TaxID=2562239 RepID=A0AA36N2V8_9DINO|nr:unnamed protein product [Effrenium voratum]CAJ1448381.1 unnamed protein product [Effrenium voratum]